MALPSPIVAPYSQPWQSHKAKIQPKYEGSVSSDEYDGAGGGITHGITDAEGWLGTFSVDGSSVEDDEDDGTRDSITEGGEGRLGISDGSDALDESSYGEDGIEALDGSSDAEDDGGAGDGITGGGDWLGTSCMITLHLVLCHIL